MKQRTRKSAAIGVKAVVQLPFYEEAVDMDEEQPRLLDVGDTGLFPFLYSFCSQSWFGSTQKIA